MNKAIQDCTGCSQSWHERQSLVSWFTDFTNWVSVGSCSFVTPALIPGQIIVVPKEQFYPCLFEWFDTDQGKYKKLDIVVDEQNRNILGWRQFVTPVKI